MKVSGFTIIRNGTKYDYPYIESMLSLLPLVDELVVAVGNSEDNTLAKVRAIGNPKIKIVETIWDEQLREGGKVLAAETDKAKAAVSPDSDWLIYLQTDELIHEQYYPAIRQAMEQYKNDSSIEGLLLHYRHFYGSYAYVADGIRWYDKEVRIIRNDANIRSYKDAQGFRIQDRKLRVKLIPAFIYHYGWVKNPVNMFHKHTDMGKWWRSDAEQAAYENGNTSQHKGKAYQYEQIDSVAKFTDSHPQVMLARIQKADWQVELDTKVKHFKNLKQRVFYHFKKKFGWRPGEYKNYKQI